MLVVALLAWAAPAAVGKAPPAPPAGRLVFGSDRDWATIPSSQIYAVNTDGTGLTKLTNFSWWAVFPAPSPDGTRIAFDGIQPEAAFGPGSKTFEFHGHAIFHSHDLYVMNADGSHVRRLTNGLSPATPAWSPDGTTVAVALRAPCPDPCNPSNIPPVSHIALMSPDGSGITQITSGPNLDWHPSWSPDGSRLAFERDFNDGSGNGAIDIVNRDGSGLRPVLVSSGTCCFSDPSWSPDGTMIAFSRDADTTASSCPGGSLCHFAQNEVWVMNADGTGLRELTHQASRQFPNGGTAPAWAPVSMPLP
jgi:Tol biopolymer transport system component